MTEDEWNNELGSPFLDFLAAVSFEEYTTEDEYGGTPLHNFAQAGAHKLFSRALQLGASTYIEHSFTVHAYDSLLYRSAIGGSVPIMERVLRDNPDANMNQQEYGKTPLHEAIDSVAMNPAMVDFILSRGADVNIRDTFGRSPLYFLICKNYHPRSKQLFKTVLSMLLKHGASLEALDCLGNTLLHHAARSGDNLYMTFLLEHGCDVNARNVKNLTPLHYAEIEGGFWDPLQDNLRRSEFRTTGLSAAVDLLLSWGADPCISGRLDIEDLLHDSVSERHAARTKELSYACLTPVGLARICPDTAYPATFHTSLHKHHPEIHVDADGDVFWDAKEYLASCGEGSEFLVVKSKDAELSNTEIHSRIWNTRSVHIYDENMLAKPVLNPERN
ncbi:hypothetical protein MMC34_004643 [Xylographa carneopallida]|nr:hypothetical protein [Xylographa carneopallida]